MYKSVAISYDGKKPVEYIGMWRDDSTIKHVCKNINNFINNPNKSKKLIRIDEVNIKNSQNFWGSR